MKTVLMMSCALVALSAGAASAQDNAATVEEIVVTAQSALKTYRTYRSP